MKRLVLVVLLAAASALPAVCQNRANFAWWNSEVVRNLNLSETQRKQIRDTVAAYRPKLIDARAEMRKSQGNLQDILNSDHIDMALATPVIDKLAKAQAESTRVFTQMSIELRSVLTLEQWRELVNRWGTLQKGRKPVDTEAQP